MNDTHLGPNYRKYSFVKDGVPWTIRCYLSDYLNRIFWYLSFLHSRFQAQLRRRDLDLQQTSVMLVDSSTTFINTDSD